MKIILKILTILAGTYILITGFMFLFKPEIVMGHAQIAANDAFGLSTIRGLIGGSMLAAGISGILAIVKNKLGFLHTASLVCVGWTFGRLISLIADGYNPGTLSGLLQSLIMAAIFTITYKVLTKKNA